VNTPIGFVDTDTNVNLTRAFWAQAGIDVAFFPVQSYNSPTNTIPSSWNNIKDAASTTGATFTYSSTNYQNLHLVNVLCQDGFVALTSPDFQALTQHPICTEHGGLAGTYSKLANPPPAPSTAPPLAINGCSKALPCSTDPITGLGNSNAIDVFFVNTYGGTGVSSPQYGFSWINGDGVSVGKAIFSITQPRYDTLAHEIGHALALTHQNFGANNDPTSASIINMMLLGSTRATSYNSGCQQKTGNFSSPPPILNNGALFDLDYITSSFNPCSGAGNMLADHLVPQPTGTPSACSSPLDPTNCFTQQGAAGASPFINQTLASSANAGGGTLASVAGAATTSNSVVAAQGTNSTSAVTFQVSATSGTGNSGDAITSIIIGIPAGGQLSFNGNSPATFVSCTDQTTTPPNSCDVTITSQLRLNGNNGFGNQNCMKSINLAPPSEQCVQVFFSSGFTAGKLVTFTVAFNKDSGTIIAQNLLAGAQYTVITGAAGYATTSVFGNAVNGVFSANSQNPDFTTPNQIQDASKFVNAAAANPHIGPNLAHCTPPYTFVKVKGQLVPVCPDGNLPDGPD
jgi:hypothetical protein